MLRSAAGKVMWAGRGRLLVVLLAIMVALVLGYVTKAYAAPGYLDPSFNTDGKLTIDFGSSNDFGQDLAVQEDGKIVVVGHTSLNSTGNGFAVARYRADGTPDSSFGTRGKVTTDVSQDEGADVGRAVVVQPDGKIVVAGTSGTSPTDIAVVRYNSDGTLDDTFGNGGTMITDLSSIDRAFDVALQGKSNDILVAGQTSTSTSGNDFAVVRYDANGALDGTFGTGGVVATDFGSNASDSARALAVEPSSGEIVVAGGASSDFAVARYDANGAPDQEFGTGGVVTTDFGSNGSFANDIAIQEDGKIVVAGHVAATTDDDFAVTRYNENGTLDQEFDHDGRVTVDFGGFDFAEGLALQDDGRMVLAGNNLGGSNFALARLNDDGSPDASFHNDGKLVTDFGGFDRANGLALQHDGRIVAAGHVSIDQKSDFAVARYFGGYDAAAPNTRTPVQTLLANSTLGTSTTSASVPTKISWSATDLEGEVTRYQFQQSINGGAYENVALPSATTTSTSRTLTPGSNYRYRVRATDDNGNTSLFKYGPRFTVDAHQETSSAIAAYSGTWKAQSISSAYGGAVKYATASGASAILVFTGRNVAWVAPKDTNRGRAEVYLDGIKVATVDLYSPTVLPRKVLYSANGLNPSVAHTLEVKVLGTKNASSSSTRVDVDAFVVLR